MSYTNATHLENAHQEWIKALDFYKEDLDILEKRLAEVSLKNTSMVARADAEHFQNQFIVQRNNIDELKHAINEHTHLVFEDMKQHAGRVEETRIDQHKKLEEDVKEFEETVNDLRHEFNKYLAK